MREAPPHITDDDVLTVVRAHWAEQATLVRHLPVGFGAHHWKVKVQGGESFFVTWDTFTTHHTPESLERAYAAARSLAEAGLEFVLAPRLGTLGHCTVPLQEGRLSVTEWVDGTSGDGTIVDGAQALTTADMLTRLHAATPPPLDPWRPLVDADFAYRLVDRTDAPWESGPFAETARQAIRACLAAVADWAADYHRLAAATDPSTWVVTHGEPHTANQLASPERTWLVDWESVRLAPRERDLKTLVENGWAHLAPDLDLELVEMFDLEWRLDEISQYADWFEAEHSGTASDKVALDGLLHELQREPIDTSARVGQD